MHIRYSIFFQISATITLFLCIVIPNSLQAATLTALIASSTLSIKNIKTNENYKNILKFHFLSTLVTITYLLIGIADGAPIEALQQVLLIYVISPVLWIITLIGLLERYGEKILMEKITTMTFLSLVSIAIFYSLFLSFGSGAVDFFKKDSNVNLNDGYAGATMHVYGPLMFLSAGFFSIPAIIKNQLIKIILLGSLSIAAITSGRSALIISLVIGFCIGLLVKPKTIQTSKISSVFSTKFLIKLIFTILIAALFIEVMKNIFGLDLELIARYHLEEITSGGGEARTEQADALIQGIISSNGLGSGHGIGVSYVRSYNFPWRYELVWYATILRVGIFGALIYTLAFIYYIFHFIKKWRIKNLSEIDIFMFAGFSAAVIASNTNPYIEGVSMQWMYILPLIQFFNKKTI